MVKSARRMTPKLILFLWFWRQLARVREFAFSAMITKH
jgi:hypothetical protein